MTRARPWIVTGCGAVGLAVSAVLTVEKFRLLADPSYRPSCNISPILSCGSVMRTEQAEAFGFPNPLLGLVGFAVVLAVGVALVRGAVLPRAVWHALYAGTVLGLVFVHWLIFQTLYEIGAVCPYCVIVWAVTILLFWQLTVRLHPRLPSHLAWSAPLLWYAFIALLVLNRFWYYWRTLL